MLLLYLVFVCGWVCVCVCAGWSSNRAERERTITKAQRRERARTGGGEREKITHVLAIKDGPRLEEEVDEESHRRIVCC